MDNPVEGKFVGRVISFSTDADRIEVCNGFGMLEVTDAGEGFAEVAFNYGDERVYLSFRVSDLLRAIKEKQP